jgi:hypothetical protein
MESNPDNVPQGIMKKQRLVDQKKNHLTEIHKIVILVKIDWVQMG